jgi:hypothetical protein
MELKRCSEVDETVLEIASEVLCKHETHKPLLDAKVTIGYMFAFPEKDKDGNYTGDALRLHGRKAFAIASITPYAGRVKGLPDCEVTIDGEWWEDCGKREECAALLDHELHHFDVRKDADGAVVKDKAGRPKLRMREHDVQFGWFNLVAARNGKHSQEMIQAAALMEKQGQYYWPSLLPQLAAPAKA